MMWKKCSAVANYSGFSSHLEMSGEDIQFVINAHITSASQVPKLQDYIALVAAILELLPARRDAEQHTKREGNRDGNLAI